MKSSQDQTDKPTPAPAPEASTTHPTVNIPDPEEEVKVNLDTVNALVDGMQVPGSKFTSADLVLTRHESSLREGRNANRR